MSDIQQQQQQQLSPPDNANVECVGPTSQSAGKASGCDGCPNQNACSTGTFSSPEALAANELEILKLKSSLNNVSHVILVLSGKGGVGKSTIATQLSHTLSSQGYAVGLLDIDLCGPSAPRMILGENYIGQEIRKNIDGSWIPIYTTQYNLAIMSISFMLQNQNQAVVWRGPRKNSLIQQFLTEVNWTGNTNGLDYLIIDTPPGTSDEHISTVQYLQKANAISGAIIVTTPEEASLADVRKELSFCIKTGVPILGLIENMSIYQTKIENLNFINKDTGIDCTNIILQKLKDNNCSDIIYDYIINTEIFTSYNGGGENMSNEYNIPFWGKLPLDTNLLKACENGQIFIDNFPTSQAAISLINFCKKINDCLPVDMSS